MADCQNQWLACHWPLFVSRATRYGQTSNSPFPIPVTNLERHRISFLFAQQNISRGRSGLEIRRRASAVVADSQGYCDRIGPDLCRHVLALDGEAVGKVGAIADQVKGHAQAVEGAAEGEMLLR